VEATIEEAGIAEEEEEREGCLTKGIDDEETEKKGIAERREN
jgi:hypothetical protein